MNYNYNYIIWCIILYLNSIKVIIISVFYIDNIFSLTTDNEIYLYMMLTTNLLILFCFE